MYQIGKMPGSIDIGYIGETNFRKIEIDMSAWMAEMPQGIPSIVHIRPGEAKTDAYVADTSFDAEKNILTWVITAADIGPHEGEGMMQVFLEEYEEDDLTKRGKSIRVTTKVNEAADDPSSTIPSAQETMLERMTTLKNQTVSAKEDAEEAKTAAEAAATAAAEATVHQPYIDSTTGNWMVWNNTTGQYTDTGIPAAGDPSTLINDTTPAQNKTFSSSKVDEELTDVKNAIDGFEENCVE